jgi:hypothetical protein|tara:strand:+ start:32 stop:289 length:258 start_codon:yes stop_codon:yes gene_type:complete
MFEVTQDFIHGASFALPFKNIDFATWRRNTETGEYWIKFHTVSGKEIRIHSSLEELNDLLDKYSRANGNTIPIEYKRNKYELDEQ